MQTRANFKNKVFEIHYLEVKKAEPSIMKASIQPIFFIQLYIYETMLKPFDKFQNLYKAMLYLLTSKSSIIETKGLVFFTFDKT